MQNINNCSVWLTKVGHFRHRTKKTTILPKQRKKQDLPQKICANCERPFTWRKKWEKDWGNVKYCSERCRREAKNKRR